MAWIEKVTNSSATASETRNIHILARHRTDRFRLAIEIAPDTTPILNESACVEYVSTEAKRLSGYRAATNGPIR